MAGVVVFEVGAVAAGIQFLFYPSPFVAMHLLHFSAGLGHAGDTVDAIPLELVVVVAQAFSLWTVLIPFERNVEAAGQGVADDDVVMIGKCFVFAVGIFYRYQIPFGVVVITYQGVRACLSCAVLLQCGDMTLRIGFYFNHAAPTGFDPLQFVAVICKAELPAIAGGVDQRVQFQCVAAHKKPVGLGRVLAAVFQAVAVVPLAQQH